MLKSSMLHKYPKPSSLKVSLAIAFAVVTWASAFVAIRAGLEGFQPGSLALLRFLIASLVMAAIFLRSPNKKKVTKGDLPILTAIGFSGYAVYNVALNSGETTVTAGIASFIMSLTPVMVVIFATMFLRERLNVFQWLGVAISVTGITIITMGRGGFEQLDTGVLFVIIAALSAAIYVILQKPMLKKFSALQLTTIGIWIGTAFLLFYTPILIQDLRTASIAAIFSVAYLGIFPAALGFLAWSYVLSHYEASKAIMYLYTMPLLTTFFSWLLLNEFPTLVSFGGGLIALAGAVVVNLKK